MSQAGSTALGVQNAVHARALPFALFIAFIAVEESARFADKWGWIALSGTTMHYLYPIKVLTVATLLYNYRSVYQEVHLREIAVAKNTAAAFGAGIITFLLWVSMDWTLPLTSAPTGFNPMLLPEGPTRALMTATRIAGAVLVVPLMEELFWRSFLLRYLVEPDFESVPVGHFTRGAFLITTMLFGLEHHFIFAGMVAGAIYNALLYKTRSLAQCVLAHAVTNLALAIYVLCTGRWYFW